MGTRAEIIRDLLLHGSYSVAMLQEHLSRIQKRPKWCDSVIKNKLKKLPVTKIDNLCYDYTMKTYLAIGVFKSGRSFRYKETAIDMLAFVTFIQSAYPTFEIESVVLVDELLED